MTKEELLQCYAAGERDFSYADLHKADLRGANLNEANLECANVNFANLRYANLSWTNLKGANLSYSDLTGINLRHADLTGATLRYANLYGAALCDANLTNADLHGVIGNMKEIKTLQLEKWQITYTKRVMAIGCEQHTIEEWRNFTDDEINKMDDDALLWWHKWKETIFNIIEKGN
jgi:hypothetical protein